MYKWIFLSLFIYSCKSPAKIAIRSYNKPGIVYQLPMPVTELLVNKIKGHEDSLYFELDRDSISFSVSILEIHKRFSDYRWIMCSNHKLKIGNLVFPLLISYDSDYGIAETPSEILLRAKSGKDFSYSKIYSTGEPYYIKFERSGKIIYAGR